MTSWSASAEVDGDDIRLTLLLSHPDGEVRAFLSFDLQPESAAALTGSLLAAVSLARQQRRTIANSIPFPGA